ncbi:MAG: hypothetical protein KBS95_05280 [Alistipes sp.]|nr:hypothetical protein [Candidatus Alistipes equi]
MFCFGCMMNHCVGVGMGLLPFAGKEHLQRGEVIRGNSFHLWHHIHHPFSWIDIGLVASSDKGVDHSSSICSIMIVSVAIVV